MVDRRVCVEREGFTGLHADGFRARTAARTEVAPKVVGGQIYHWGVVICVLTDVFPHGVLGSSGRKLLEDVMGRHFAHGERQSR